MPADRQITQALTQVEIEAVTLFLSHTGLRDWMRQLGTRFSHEGYLKQYEADPARAYIELQWKTLQRHFSNLPLTFASRHPAVETLVRIGWAEPYSEVRNGYFRWKPEAFQSIFSAESVDSLLGAAGYAKLWGLIFFSYLRTVFDGMNLDPTLSNERAEEILLSEERFGAKGYGETFAKEVQRVWAPQQAVTWASNEVPVVLSDLKDSERLLVSYLVRIYTGTFTNPKIRTKYGNWRAGMAPVSRIGLVSE